MEAGADRESWWQLIKKGNTSSAIAMTGNATLAAIKGAAAAFSGSGAMFASSMHSLADAINQGFVFVGSVLSEKRPTRRFPSGFGRVINIFCMIAVLVVTVMAYETVLEGWHLLQHPVPSGGLWLNVGVLIVNLLIDGYILVKAMREIVKETRSDARGPGIAAAAFRNVGRAAPPTRLVFYEDIVAVTGALLALLAVVMTAWTNATLLDGLVTVLIGLLMFVVAFRVGYDNMIGLIGVAAPREIEDRVAGLIVSEPLVTDIFKMRILQEGRFYHVEAYVELRKGMTLADADDVKFALRDKLLRDPDIADATLGILEDDQVRSWTRSKDKRARGKPGS